MLALRLLGSPSATLDGEQLNDQLLKKDLALLYLLVAHQHTGIASLRRR